MKSPKAIEFGSMIFNSGQTVSCRGGPASLMLESFGRLRIASGKVIASDPFFRISATLVESLPTGDFEVIGTIARMETDGVVDERIAYASIRFSANPIVCWRLMPIGASVVGEDPNQSCYVVDSGTGAFMDATVVSLLKRDPLARDLHKALSDEFGKNYVTTRAWANYLIPHGDGLNLVAFLSGYGDGCYSSYVGHDSNGNVACLTTDFQVLVDPDEPLRETEMPPIMFRETIELAEKSFSRKDYRRVVKLLEPVEHRLSGIQKRKLDFAKSRVK